MDDESSYWHFAYAADPESVRRLEDAWVRAQGLAVARQRGDLERSAPFGFRPSPSGDGSFVEFDWDHGAYDPPSDDELATCLGGLVGAPRASVGDLFEAVVAGCIHDAANLGLGGVETWPDLVLPRGLPHHPGAEGMSGWATSWAAGDELRAWVARLGGHAAKKRVTKVLARYQRVADAGGAILSAEAKNPFV
jgi:hypothetical protein